MDDGQYGEMCNPTLYITVARDGYGEHEEMNELMEALADDVQEWIEECNVDGNIVTTAGGAGVDTTDPDGTTIEPCAIIAVSLRSNDEFELDRWINELTPFIRTVLIQFDQAEAALVLGNPFFINRKP